MNQADSETLQAILQAAGHVETADPSAAGLIVLNTCSVREKAVERLIGYARSLRPSDGATFDTILAIGGCVAQTDGDRLVNDIPGVNILFGPSSFHRVADAVDEFTRSRAFVDFRSKGDAVPENLPRAFGNTRAWLPISRGCNNYCAYCVVPYARGPEISRPFEAIVQEAEELVRAGAKEITLLGQNVNSFGNDRGETDAFAALLRRLDALDGLARIRFMTSHPKDLSEATAGAIAECGSVCEHIHLPLQSGSDEILNKMNRGYSVEDYRRRIEMIRRLVPNASITTDIIVGFPGESEEDFLATLAVVKDIRFDSAYTFIYSSRPGTAAAELPDGFDYRTKEARLRRLVETQNSIAASINESAIGSIQEVLVEGRAKRGNIWSGRTRADKIVHFDAGEDLTGEIVHVIVESSTSATFAGSLCG